jgi:hypothetical protein
LVGKKYIKHGRVESGEDTVDMYYHSWIQCMIHEKRTNCTRWRNVFKKNYKRVLLYLSVESLRLEKELSLLGCFSSSLMRNESADFPAKKVGDGKKFTIGGNFVDSFSREGTKWKDVYCRLKVPGDVKYCGRSESWA